MHKFLSYLPLTLSVKSHTVLVVLNVLLERLEARLHAVAIEVEVEVVRDAAVHRFV